MNILEKQKKLQNEARDLLDKIGLIGFLSKFGEVKIVGSMALGLMTWADIDIDLGVTEFKGNDYLDTVTYLFSNQKVRKLILSDNRFLTETLTARGIPESLYLGVFVESDSEVLWKIDIRFVLLKNLRADSYVEETKLKINDETREKILEIKEIICLDQRYLNKEISSVDIYKAVLDENIQDVEGFRSYLEKVDKSDLSKTRS